MLGVRQSGMQAFRFARLPEDVELLERARYHAREILDARPGAARARARAARGRHPPRLRRRRAGADPGMKALDTLAARLGYVRPLVRVQSAPDGLDGSELLEPEFLALYERAQPFTMTSRERMYALWQAVRAVQRRATATSSSAASGAAAARCWPRSRSQLGDRERTLWLYDTFEGMPDPGPQRRRPAGRSRRGDWEQLEAEDELVFARASLEDVRANMAGDRRAGRTACATSSGRSRTRSRRRAGAHRAAAPGHRLVRVHPARAASTVSDRLMPGGVLIIDDYGHWQGARRAVDECFAGRDDAPLLTRRRLHGPVAVKLPART